MAFDFQGVWQDGKVYLSKSPAQKRAEELVYEEAMKLDPVKYEIFSHGLYHSLDEIKQTTIRIGVSPIIRDCGEAMHAYYTADGDPVMTAAGLSLHVGASGYVIKYIMQEHRDEIKDGDQWFANDPMIGGIHALDQALLTPIFYQGELIGWMGSLTHVPEVGAIEPGGMCPKATERYHEGIMFPAVKILDGGVHRKDIWNALAAACRESHTIQLDTVAKIAANLRGKKRILDFIETYGVDFVKLAFRRLIIDSEKRAKAKISRFLDGQYFARIYGDNDGTGNEKIWHIDCLATVKGDELTLDYTGTTPQNQGALNCSIPGTMGGIFSGLCSQIFYDLAWNQGLLNAIKVVLPDNTVVNPSKDAAVSLCPGQVAEAIANVTAMAINKMRLASEVEIEDINACWAVGPAGTPCGGIDQFNRVVASQTFDHMAGGMGAKMDEDGVDTGARAWAPEADCADIETWEHFYPLLYLGRGNLIDGYGFGEFRGGSTIQKTVMIHKAATGKLTSGSWTTGRCISQVPGAFGAYPANRSCFMVATRTGAYEKSQQGIPMPHWADDLIRWGKENDVVVKELPTPSFYLQYKNGDILYLRINGAGGIGDPILRDPQAVLLDYKNSMVSLAAAEKIYGVVINSVTLEIDETATRDRRAQIRKERLARGKIIAQAIQKN